MRKGNAYRSISNRPLSLLRVTTDRHRRPARTGKVPLTAEVSHSRTNWRNAAGQLPSDRARAQGGERGTGGVARASVDKQQMAVPHLRRLRRWLALSASGGFRQMAGPHLGNSQDSAPIRAVSNFRIRCPAEAIPSGGTAEGKWLVGISDGVNSFCARRRRRAWSGGLCLSGSRDQPAAGLLAGIGQLGAQWETAGGSLSNVVMRRCAVRRVSQRSHDPISSIHARAAHADPLAEPEPSWILPPILRREGTQKR